MSKVESIGLDIRSYTTTHWNWIFFGYPFLVDGFREPGAFVVVEKQQWELNWSCIGLDRLSDEMNNMKFRDDKEIEAIVVVGNGRDRYIIVMTSGGRNGQAKQDLHNMVTIKDADFSDVDAVFCCLPHGTTQCACAIVREWLQAHVYVTAYLIVLAGGLAVHAKVVTIRGDDTDAVIPGLMAAGEAACASVKKKVGGMRSLNTIASVSS